MVETDIVTIVIGAIASPNAAHWLDVLCNTNRGLKYWVLDLNTFITGLLVNEKLQPPNLGIDLDKALDSLRLAEPSEDLNAATKFYFEVLTLVNIAIFKSHATNPNSKDVRIEEVIADIPLEFYKKYSIRNVSETNTKSTVRWGEVPFTEQSPQGVENSDEYSVEFWRLYNSYSNWIKPFIGYLIQKYPLVLDLVFDIDDEDINYITKVKRVVTQSFMTTKNYFGFGGVQLD